MLAAASQCIGQAGSFGRVCTYRRVDLLTVLRGGSHGDSVEQRGDEALSRYRTGASWGRCDTAHGAGSIELGTGREESELDRSL